MNLTHQSGVPVDWAPVMASEHVPPGQIIQGFLHGQELAIWRNGQGEIQVWENRCPHRGTRFTLGRIIDGQLSCAYHGWRFAGGGQCTFIPAQPKLTPPQSMAATAYFAVERFGMVWAALGQPASDEPAIPELSAPARRAIFCRSFVTYGSAADVIKRMQPAYTSGGPGVLIDASGPETIAVLLVQPMASQKSVVHLWLSCTSAADGDVQLRQQYITHFKRQRRDIECALAA
jgi:phenylpropionate dioxygenase-like ring-hydroxylating dioxygenase large terminal subunit